jgi:hypothetical protein
MPIHEMSKWEFILNNPAWVGLIGSTLFAIATTVIIWRQVCVMQAQVRVMVWQGRNSYRHERIQNRLIKSQIHLFSLQLEQQRIQILNTERLLLLRLGRKLHLAAACLEETRSIADPLNWNDVQDTVHELQQRLSVLDVDAYDGEYDEWFFHLKEWIDAVQDAVIKDRDCQPSTGVVAAVAKPEDDVPATETIRALHGAEKTFNPIRIFLEIETAIRMEFFDYKNKSEAVTVV